MRLSREPEMVIPIGGPARNKIVNHVVEQGVVIHDIHVVAFHRRIRHLCILHSPSGHSVRLTSPASAAGGMPAMSNSKFPYRLDRAPEAAGCLSTKPGSRCRSCTREYWKYFATALRPFIRVRPTGSTRTSSASILRIVSKFTT